jgi:FtsZ-binding cell division protein ZapB
MEIQTPTKTDNVNKRAISEVADMEIDEPFSSKRSKIEREKVVVILEEDEPIKQGGNVVIVEEEQSLSNTEERILEPVIQIQQYLSSDAQNSQFKSKKELITQYAQKKKQLFEEGQKLFSEVRKLSQNKVSLVTVKDAERNTLNIAVTEENKVTEMKIKTDQINAPDKIHLHKQTSEMIYGDLLQSTLNIARLERKVTKLEGKLKQEKETNRAWHIQIKRIESYIMVVGAEPGNMQPIKKFLEEKENTIQVMKKKLKIPGMSMCKPHKLTTLQQEKYSLQQELMNYKEKVLQLEDEKQEWQKERDELLLRNVTASSSQEKDVSTENMVKSMSQVKLKDVEIEELKQENQKLKQEAAQRSEKSNQIQKEHNCLQEKVSKLKSRIKGKVPLQGAKHLLWDSLAVDITKFRQYLNFVDDKSIVASTTLHRCVIVNETLLKRPLEWAQNAINLLNAVSNAYLQTIGVKDRTVVIVCARKIIGKHNHMRNVRSKAEKIEQNVQSFKDLFSQLFKRGLPSFWNNNGKMVSQEKYNVLLTQARMDHSKFEDLEKGLKGNTIVDKLTNDFEILSQFRTIKSCLPPISYASCIELEVLIKEMVDYDIPSESQWKEVERLGRSKYKFPAANQS